MSRLAFFRCVALLAVVGMPAFPIATASAQSQVDRSTVLDVRGTQFTLNDRPAFLLGISYYGALGASEPFIRQDLDDFERHGFNWIRVWATWGAFDQEVSAVDDEGRSREPFLQKLAWLVAECDRRGMVVDVTLTRAARPTKSIVGGGLLDLAAHERAVRTIVTSLKPHRNWYLDLANERDVRDARYVPVDEIKHLREFVRHLDPSRLVTASFGGHDLSHQDVRDAVIESGLDFLSVHRPRNAESPRQTEARTRELLAFVAALPHPVPIHHQEPFRRGYGKWEPTAEDFLTDLRGAVAGGAAGWCFHNGSQRGAPDQQPRRSFDLRQRRLVDQLDDQERMVLAQARTMLPESNRKNEDSDSRTR